MRPTYIPFLALLGAFCACSSETPDFVGPSSDEIAGGERECESGDTQPCKCSSGVDATQSCKAGKFSACGPCEAATPRCGDKKCDPGETCDSCASDCACTRCTEAPACTAGKSPPATSTPASDLNLRLSAVTRAEAERNLALAIQSGSPEMRILAAALADTSTSDAPVVKMVRDLLATAPALESPLRRQLASLGLRSPLQYRVRFPVAPKLSFMDAPAAGASCGPPQLSVRVARVVVSEEDDDLANDIIYCALTAKAKAGEEARVTPKTVALDEGQSHDFVSGQATFWGQQGPRAPEGDLSLTYNCFEVDNGASYAGLLKSLGEKAKQYGDTLIDEAGWVSTAIDVVATAMTVIVALDGDDHLFQATQTIPAARHLAMTNGASWSVMRSGTHSWSDWKWTLEMQAWGCAKNGGGVR